MEKVQVAIIGGGPAGLLLARLLQLGGVRAVVLERQSREYVEARVRAGVLEEGTVALLREAGVAARLEREGLRHDGFDLAFANGIHRVDIQALTGKHVTVYGQSEIQKDLASAHLESGGVVHYGAEDVEIGSPTGSSVGLRYRHHGVLHELDCDFVVGCDGFHGVSRRSIPLQQLRQFERVYPFGWLGVLADVPPVAAELVYANHRNGFALCSMRSTSRSRYYVQCGLDDTVEQWPDGRFWDELRSRLPDALAARLQTGPTVEKSIAPLRSFVVEPIRHGRLFLVGDAAHIVPPTGAKGLNLAVADVRVLYEALAAFYIDGSTQRLDDYSPRALARVWNATRFSWWFTSLTHKFSTDEFAHRLQLAELDNLRNSEAASRAMAENYVGML